VSVPSCRSAVRIASIATVALLAFAACSEKKEAAKAPPPVPEVRVVQTRAETVPVLNEYVGRIAAYRSVEVRARVQGIVEKRVFTEGTDVKRGDLLYVIEPVEYQKAVDNAKASLARANADLANAQAREKRLAPLVKEQAISQQDYDDAMTAVKQQEAALAAARATLDRAEIDLGYTKVYANESGRIGQTLVPEGRLVGKDGPTQLATIDRIDQVYVIFTLSDRDALELRRAIEAGRIRATAEGANSVRVYLPDGTEYKEGGRIDFSDQQVNPDTGTITTRGVMPNPKRELLPGMFVRVVLNVGQRPNTVLVPQRAVVKTPTGHMVWVVGKDNKIERRDLVVGLWYGDDWIVEKGLGPDEAVVVDGVQRVQPGIAVRASPYVAASPGPTAIPTPKPVPSADPKAPASPASSGQK
jgi:membrane fusion protein, multidrug efflux system